MKAMSEKMTAHGPKKYGVQKIGDSDLAPQVSKKNNHFFMLICFFNIYINFFIIGHYWSCWMVDEELPHIF